MRGYWKIEKEWMHGWGLTASEAVVLADLLSWNGINGEGCTLKERAERCCMSLRNLKYTIAKLRQNESAKIALSECKNCTIQSAKIAPKKCKNCTLDGAKIALPPITPNIVEEHIEEHEEHIRLDKSNLPNAVASAVKKEPRKKADKTPSIQHRCRLHFEAAYEAKKGDKYYYAAKDAAALKGVLKKIQFLMPEADKENEAALENNFKIFVDAIFNSRTLGTWINDNLSLPLINGKFNEIYAQLKDNGSNHNRINKHVSISADLLAEFTGANTGSFHNGR